MADYTDYNEGISGKGILVALLLVGIIIFALVFFGSGRVAPDGGVTDTGAVQTAPTTSDTLPTSVPTSE